MTAFLQRFAYWWRGEPASYASDKSPNASYVEDDQPAYLSDFGPNVPVENLGGDPVFYENGQPVYWEHAP